MSKPTPTTLAVDTLATYRLTKLVIDDEITREAREWAYEQANRLPAPLASKVTYLLGCPWCVSIWAAGTLLLLRKVNPALADYLNTLLAASAVTGVLAERVA